VLINVDERCIAKNVSRPTSTRCEYLLETLNSTFLGIFWAVFRDAQLQRLEPSKLIPALMRYVNAMPFSSPLSAAGENKTCA
jgi:hypothetical protein